MAYLAGQWYFPDPVWTTMTMVDRTARIARVDDAVTRHLHVGDESVVVDESDAPDEVMAPREADYAGAELVCGLLDSFGPGMQVEVRLGGEHDIPLEVVTPPLTITGTCRDATFLGFSYVGPDGEAEGASACSNIRAIRVLP